ncbi:MAG: hypothetical protein U9Q77_14020 [Candidatus Marinimicrobia bacterium]|nr:hypothetical protein [Candidatus Neomarinimicrobiota bacterium]
MSEPEKKYRRKRKSKRHQNTLIQDFGVEIIIGIFFLFGVFLLYEDMEIKSSVFQGILALREGFGNLISGMSNSIIGIINAIEGSDIVGGFFILFAFILLSIRARQKAIIRYSDLSECPDCGGDLLHVHRSLLQRITSKVFFLKIRRYTCKSCDFEGLRIRPKHSR